MDYVWHMLGTCLARYMPPPSPSPPPTSASRVLTEADGVVPSSLLQATISAWHAQEVLGSTVGDAQARFLLDGAIVGTCIEWVVGDQTEPDPTALLDALPDLQREQMENAIRHFYYNPSEDSARGWSAVVTRPVQGGGTEGVMVVVNLAIQRSRVSVFTSPHPQRLVSLYDALTRKQ